VAAVPFEVELALECLVDRLYDLAQWLEQVGAGALLMAVRSTSYGCGR
jgi:hypothetical protein